MTGPRGRDVSTVARVTRGKRRIPQAPSHTGTDVGGGRRTRRRAVIVSTISARAIQTVEEPFVSSTVVDAGSI